MTMLEAALSYAEQGYAVFPMRSRSKQSCIMDWPNKATTDADQIRRWWGQWPNANIGIATGAKSGVVVIDVDGQQGVESLAQLEAQLGALPRDVTVRTGSGGLHIYCRIDAGQAIANSIGALAKNIDVRGDGGCVVAPPSIHPNGSSYEWIANAT